MKIILYLEKNHTLFGNLSVATLQYPNEEICGMNRCVTYLYSLSFQRIVNVPLLHLPEKDNIHILPLKIRLRVIIPTAHNSDDPLFRQPIILTAHCSDHTYIIIYVIIIEINTGKEVFV